MKKQAEELFTCNVSLFLWKYWRSSLTVVMWAVLSTDPRLFRGIRKYSYKHENMRTCWTSSGPSQQIPSHLYVLEGWKVLRHPGHSNWLVCLNMVHHSIFFSSKLTSEDFYIWRFSVIQDQNSSLWETSQALLQNMNNHLDDEEFITGPISGRLHQAGQDSLQREKYTHHFTDRGNGGRE